MALKIALVHDAAFPVQAYGGTERVVWWLSKGLSELGHQVYLVCRKKESATPYATLIDYDSQQHSGQRAISGAQVIHYFNTPPHTPPCPYLVTIGGNGKVGERYHSNTVFVSRSHAVQHSAQCFVHNGVDPQDYEFEPNKDAYLLFLAKATWRVKNIRGAIRISARAGRALTVIGGSRNWWLHRRHVNWQGLLGGPQKAKHLARAYGLLFPVEWNEPFGLAPIEALVSGTPVIASRRGALPETIHSDVGFLCGSEEECVQSIERLSEISADRCREWALENFHYRTMAEKYVELYEKVLSGEALNSSEPRAMEPPEQIYPLTARIH